MDIEKMVKAVKLCGSTPKVDQCKQCTYWAGGDMSKCIPRMTLDATTALSTLQAENARLRADLEYEREHANAYHEECGQWEAENEKLRAGLEQVKRCIEIVENQRDQMKRERDAAIEKYNTEKEDFLDYVLSGTQNAAPFCRNRHPDCVDKRGWCISVKCHGFSRDKED